MTKADFNDQFRERLKDLRAILGLTQEDVAEAIGVNLDSYKKYESRSMPPIYLLPRIAARLNVTVQYLVTGRNTVAPAINPRRRGRASQG